MLIVLGILWVGFAVSRFIVPVEGKLVKKDVFKDMAHLYVGFLFGAASYAGLWELWAMGGSITAVEVAAFVLRKR